MSQTYDFFETSVAEIYSASVVDTATILCNLEYYETPPTPRVSIYPLVNLHVSTSPTIPTSQNPCNSPPLNISKCTLLGLAMDLLTTHCMCNVWSLQPWHRSFIELTVASYFVQSFLLNLTVVKTDTLKRLHHSCWPFKNFLCCGCNAFMLKADFNWSFSAWIVLFFSSAIRISPT